MLIRGDFNHARIAHICDREITNVVKRPTCGADTLDLTLTIPRRWYQSCTTLLPTDKSDHFSVGAVATAADKLPDSAIRTFGRWITGYDWRPVLDAPRHAKQRPILSMPSLWNSWTSTFQSNGSRLAPLTSLRSLSKWKTHHQKTTDFPSWPHSPVETLRKRRQQDYNQCKGDIHQYTKLSQDNPTCSSLYATAKQLSGARAPSHSRMYIRRTSAMRSLRYTSTSTSPASPALYVHGLDTETLPAYLPASRPAPLQQTVSRSQMWRKLSQVKVHRAPGSDGVPNIILKRSAFDISIPACDILNLRLGAAPNQWKQAVIIPVSKVMPTPSLDKFRPISL